MGETQWIMCPVCGSKTRLRIRYDTVLERFPLYCPKCKQETLISVRPVSYTHLVNTIYLIYLMPIIINIKLKVGFHHPEKQK